MFFRLHIALWSYFLSMLGMRLITQQAAAELIGVGDRTIRNMISRGDLTGYQIPGVRAVRVDRDELMSKLRAIPTRSGRQEFVHGKPKFNGNVKVVNAPIVVAEASE